MNEKVGLALKKSKILIMGVAYKKNISDTRESPALKIISLLEKQGVSLDYYDPYVKRIANYRSLDEVSSKKYQQYDAVVIITDHDEIDYQSLFDAETLVVDTRNISSNYHVSTDKVFKV